MAFSMTLLSWSIIEFGGKMGIDASNAMDVMRWGTDYLLKAIAEPYKIHVQVGDPCGDHNCWERPEDMDTPRTVYTVDATKPGSEVAAERAAASMVFQSSDPDYAKKLLERAMTVFDFADAHRGSYSESLGKWVCPFYCDFSGYEELIHRQWRCTISHVYREANYVADRMASLSLELKVYSDPPASIVSILSDDYNFISTRTVLVI